MDCMKCLKYLVFIFNLLFWICGMAILALAIYLRFDKTSADYVIAADKNVYYTGCYILMGAGGLMTLVGFLGCCGAWRENRCMLAMFFSFLLIILVAELGVGILAFLNQQEIEHELISSMQKFIENSYGVDNSTRTQALDALQQKLECCGAEDWHDYKKNPMFINEADFDKRVPNSCCHNKLCNTLNNFDQGCGPAAIGWFDEHFLVVMIVGFAVGIVEVLGMILSMTLCCMLQRRYGNYKN